MRVGPAGGDGAGVHALVGNAGLRRGAVRLLPAADQAHLVEADVAEEAVVVHAAGQHALRDLIISIIM